MANKTSFFSRIKMAGLCLLCVACIMATACAPQNEEAGGIRTNLNLQQVQDITLGAARVTEEADGYYFYRFTEEQQKLYEERNPKLARKGLSTTGIQLSFRTDSEELYLKITAKPGSGRSYFAMEVFVNDQRVDCIANFDNAELLADLEYAEMELPLGEYEKTIALGEGEKTVRVVLPWSTQTVIQEIALTEGATLEPVKPSKKLLAFGDSITQGFDALYPSSKYISRLAEYWDAEEYNKAVGGEVFFPELAATKEEITPDYITVAYGTNDWNSLESKELFLQQCGDFFKNLRSTYPDTPILVITPIWRKLYISVKPTGSFDSVDGLIRSVVEQYENVTVVSGMNLVEHDLEIFADRALHPSDKGFSQYYDNLIKALG